MCVSIYSNIKYNLLINVYKNKASKISTIGSYIKKQNILCYYRLLTFSYRDRLSASHISYSCFRMLILDHDWTSKFPIVSYRVSLLLLLVDRHGLKEKCQTLYVQFIFFSFCHKQVKYILIRRRLLSTIDLTIHLDCPVDFNSTINMIKSQRFTILQRWYKCITYMVYSIYLKNIMKQWYSNEFILRQRDIDGTCIFWYNFCSHDRTMNAKYMTNII